MDLSGWIEGWAAQAPDKVAVHFEGTDISYGQMAARVRRLAAALEDGWFHTGDIGHRDADGFIWIDERKKDVVISGGESIYPAELENVLADCPEIVEAAVVARPDQRWGEVAVAVVVAKPGCGLDAAGVLALFDGRLARFKHPRDVVFVDALPRNVMGKVLKYELRERLRR